MFHWLKKKKETEETVAPVEETSSFTMDEELASAMESGMPAPAVETDIDAISVIESFMNGNMVSSPLDSVLESPEATVVETQDDVLGDVEMDEMEMRLFSLNDVVLHYYLSCYRSWAEAFFTALDEVPALCLAVPGSPIEFADAADADEVAQDLGYDSWEALSQMSASKFTSSPFLEKFSRATLDFAKKNWFADIEKATPAEYAEAVISELRANLPGTRASVEQFLAQVFEQIPDGKVVADSGEAAYLFGIEAVDGNWLPVSFIVASADDYDKTMAEFAEYNKRKPKTDEKDDVNVFDEDILSLVYLQSYGWSNRSWSKATENALGFLNSCFTFCLACVSPDYHLIDVDTAAARVERIEELAEQLMDDNGNVVLNQIAPGNPQDLRNLDAPSREFVELNQEQAETNFIADVNQVIQHLMGAMSGIKRTVADMVIDEILACVWATADLTSPTSQVRAVNALHDKTLNQLEAKQKSYKSRWKKYLAKHETAVELLKNNVIITDMNDDGEPVFLPFEPGNGENDEAETEQENEA